MRWIWVVVSVLSGTIGDLMSAKGMAMHGEIESFEPRGLARVLRYIATHRLILGGILSNAISFFSFLALLSVSELSFAVPATALSYIVKTFLAECYLQERVTGRRWMGVAFVAAGIILIAV